MNGACYYLTVIRGFRAAATEELWRKGRSKHIPAQIHRVALRKLQMLDAAARLQDLLAPPGNRLEALRGDRLGQHSIRINDQYRICFEWRERDAFEVEIADYH